MVLAVGAGGQSEQVREAGVCGLEGPGGGHQGRCVCVLKNVSIMGNFKRKSRVIGHPPPRSPCFTLWHRRHRLPSAHAPPFPFL